MDAQAKGLMKIGEFALRVGKSIETLRSWDKSGKLKPALKQGENGHRFYTEAQVQQVLQSGAGATPQVAYNAEFLNKMDKMMQMMNSMNSKVSEIDAEDIVHEEDPLDTRLQDIIDEVENLSESDDRDLAAIRLREAALLLKRSGAFDKDEDGTSSLTPTPVG